jgi:dimethylhistidine N-methyltransferase
MFAAAADSAPLFRLNTAFARDVGDGLARRRKTLPASWLYDEIGSALFEVITLLPEYGLTRADSGLLAAGAGEIIRAAHSPRRIVELGSGSGTKTRHILYAASRSGPVTYRPIDISAAALALCAQTLGGMDAVRVEPIAATYIEGIEIALKNRRAGERAMILFLGSTIGNFNRAEAASFLRSLRGYVRPGDSLLLGADLVKPRERLLLAYDDPAGVTAAFNLNLLARINRELAGEFNLAQFAHEARYNERQARVEMHLRSRAAQQVRIGALNVTVAFGAGETIWTESSHKFRADEIGRLGARAGWSCERQWLDREWGFAETLFQLR